MTSLEPGRNDPCPCGSGLKYKKCCLQKDDPVPSFLSNQETDHVRSTLIRAAPDIFEPPRAFKTTLQGQVLRPIWNRLEIRSPTEHFQEFLLDILKRTVSVTWIRSEL